METEKCLSPENALKKFLLDIDCLDPLENSNSFNPFDVLKIARTEIRHSNMLAWLFDPNENHGFGTNILSALIAFIVQKGFVDDKAAFHLLTLQYPDVIVKREWQNIDILIESRKEKYVICIENKVDTQDHSNQLNRYYNTINATEQYNGFTKIFLYLTPEGLVPNEDGYSAWEIFQYADIINLIEREIEKVSLNSEVRSFVKCYLDILRRETMEDTTVAELCRKIYADHKQALDLIFEYRPDMLQNAGEIFKKWCKNKEIDGEIVFDENKSNKTYYRFRTEQMSRIIPDATVKSEWNTYNHYYYELNAVMDKGAVKYGIHFVVNSTNLGDDEKRKLEELCRECNKDKKWNTGWKFITPASSNKYTLTADDFEDMQNEENVMKNLDKAWNAVKKKTEELLSKKIGL